MADTIDVERPPRVLAVAAALLVALVVLPGAIGLASQILRTTETKESTLTPMAERLDVTARHGDVTLTPSVDGEVTVRTTSRYGVGKPELIEESTVAGVVLDSRCDDVLDTECGVDYEISVPPSFTVAVETGGGGEVSARGLTGPLTLETNGGDVRLADVSGPLDIRRSGEVIGAQLRSEQIGVDTSSGDVRLSLVTPPRSLAVDTRSGEITLTVPSSVGYRITTDSDTGEQSVDVASDPASDRTIRATSQHGDIRIAPTP